MVCGDVTKVYVDGVRHGRSAAPPIEEGAAN
jgi:hypothetical protein